MVAPVSFSEVNREAEKCTQVRGLLLWNNVTQVKVKSNPPNDDFTEIIRHIENLRNHVIDYLALQVDYGYAGSMT